MGSLHIAMPASLLDWVQSRVDAGEFGSAEEYLCDLVQQDQEAMQGTLSVDDIRQSIEAARRSETVPAADVFTRLEAKLRAREA
jgi:antitoxin ParD1/3/4